MAKKEIERTGSQAGFTPSTDWWAQYPLFDLHRRMNQLFDTFSREFGASGLEPGGRDVLATRGSFGPAEVRVEVSEDDDAISIAAELPGLDEKDVDVQLTNGSLTIKGEKTGGSEKKGRTYYFSERSYGAFQRSFRLPESVDEDKISAQFSKGVLTVTLPKKSDAKSKAKKINVKAQ